MSASATTSEVRVERVWPSAPDTPEPRVMHGVPLCFYRFGDPSIVARLRELCLDAEAQILDLPLAPSWQKAQAEEGLAYTGTTARYPYYNVLLMRDVVVVHLFRAIQTLFFTVASAQGLDRSPVWVQCWQNVIRRGQALHEHAHPYFMHGHLTVATPGSATGYVFDDGARVEIPNEPGLLTLIGRAGVRHYTTENASDEPRITIAFDLCREPQMTNEVLAVQRFIPLL